MRIKKVSQTTPVQAHLTNAYSESTQDGYSADYINNNVGIVESSGNVNGYYIKFADGTLIQHYVITIPSNTSSVVITFPTAFFNTNYRVSLTNIYTNSATIFLSIANKTKTSVPVFVRNMSGNIATTSVSLDWIAIGRWK